MRIITRNAAPQQGRVQGSGLTSLARVFVSDYVLKPNIQVYFFVPVRTTKGSERRAIKTYGWLRFAINYSRFLFVGQPKLPGWTQRGVVRMFSPLFTAVQLNFPVSACMLDLSKALKVTKTRDFLAVCQWSRECVSQVTSSTRVWLIAVATFCSSHLSHSPACQQRSLAIFK